MRSLLVAISFLTRLPAGRFAAFNAEDVSHSAGWFPVVGLLLGAIYALAAFLLKSHLPLVMVAVLLVILDALATGALHFDGLADTADGFGGGKNREDILRIMRDHAIGSYGGVGNCGSGGSQSDSICRAAEAKYLDRRINPHASLEPLVYSASDRGVALCQNVSVRGRRYGEGGRCCGAL